MNALRRAVTASGQGAGAPEIAHIRRGEVMWRRGESGAVFRVSRGAVRLDYRYADGTSGFGGLALAGDVIGQELVSQPGYAFTASALTPVTIEVIACDPVCDAVAVSQLLAANHRRTARLLALTRGAAAQRVRTLLLMIAVSTSKQRMVALPPGRDIAEITGLTIETVSRQISAMRRSGELVRAPHGGWSSAWSFRLCPPASRGAADDKRELAAA